MEIKKAEGEEAALLAARLHELDPAAEPNEEENSEISAQRKKKWP